MRQKYRSLRSMSEHELSGLDEDFNLAVLANGNVAIVILTKEELDRVLKHPMKDQYVPDKTLRRT